MRKCGETQLELAALLSEADAAWELSGATVGDLNGPLE